MEIDYLTIQLPNNSELIEISFYEFIVINEALCGK